MGKQSLVCIVSEGKKQTLRCSEVTRKGQGITANPAGEMSSAPADSEVERLLAVKVAPDSTLSISSPLTAL